MRACPCFYLLFMLKMPNIDNINFNYKFAASTVFVNISHLLIF